MGYAAARGAWELVWAGWSKRDVGREPEHGSKEVLGRRWSESHLGPSLLHSSWMWSQALQQSLPCLQWSSRATGCRGSSQKKGCGIALCQLRSGGAKHKRGGKGGHGQTFEAATLGFNEILAGLHWFGPSWTGAQGDHLLSSWGVKPRDLVDPTN